jgi:hypothetical protein
VTLADGDIDKINRVTVSLQSSSSAPANQPGAQTGFAGECTKSGDPKIWDCDAVIPDAIADGNYGLVQVAVVAGNFGNGYRSDFGVPVVPIENSRTFRPPSKVTVTQQP